MEALVVGPPAEGFGTSATEAAYLYEAGSLLSVSSSTTYAAAAPHQSVILAGTFMDPGRLDTHTASIDWGDGSITTVQLPAGAYAFSAPHVYTSDSAANYSIGVTLKDNFGATAVAQTTVGLSDPAPKFAPPGLVLSSSTINENDALSVSGTIISPGGTHTNTVTIDWGDGSSPPSTLVLPPSVFTFSAPHTYLDNPSGQSSGTYSITAQVIDEEGQVGPAASSTVTVSNVAPQFTAADLSLSESTASENDTVTLNGRFTDPGTLDPHNVTINWGDGSQTVLLGLLGQVIASASPGLFTYSAAHQYLDNPDGEPSGGTYDINVSVSDDVSETSRDIPIIVNNVPPVVRIESAGNFGLGTIGLTALVTDPGRLDASTLGWTLTRNGTEIMTGAGSSFTFATPGPVGVLVATATALDSDGGAGSGRLKSWSSISQAPPSSSVPPESRSLLAETRSRQLPRQAPTW